MTFHASNYVSIMWELLARLWLCAGWEVLGDWNMVYIRFMDDIIVGQAMSSIVNYRDNLNDYGNE